MTTPFDLALLGENSSLEHDNGTFTDLQVRRWWDEPNDIDGLLLDRCRGSTIDIGCGPGRFTRALLTRGIAAMGIDTSAEAVRMTLHRGGFALLHSVFDALPDEGHWQHVLLADGNIGIGGDPGGLLQRVRSLLRPGGSALIEVGAPGTGLRAGSARLGDGPWFPWAEVDAENIEVLGATADLTIAWTLQHEDRHFVELARQESLRSELSGRVE